MPAVDVSCREAGQVRVSGGRGQLEQRASGGGGNLALVGRGVLAVMLASVLVAFLLLVTFDLDRATRGMIRIPDTALTNQLASMTQPPTATAPSSPRR